MKVQDVQPDKFSSVIEKTNKSELIQYESSHSLAKFNSLVEKG